MSGSATVTFSSLALSSVPFVATDEILVAQCSSGGVITGFVRAQVGAYLSGLGSGGSSYTLPAATSAVLGGVSPDGTTIHNMGGVISIGIVPVGNVTGAVSTAYAAATFYPLTNPAGYQTAANVTSALAPYVLTTALTTALAPLATTAAVGTAIAAAATALNVATIAALRLNTTGVPTAILAGYATALDGGEGVFVIDALDATSADNGGTIIVDAAGHRWYRQFDRSTVNAKWFGCKGTWTTGATPDDTLAARAALATGYNVFFPTGKYCLSDMLTTTTPGQRVTGAGRGRTLFVIPTTFNLSATSIFYVNDPTVTTVTDVPGPEFSDFGFLFAQIDSYNPSVLIHFPPAFYINATPRTRFRRLRIAQGWVGINFVGQCGGAVIDDLETSCLAYNVMIDGCADTMRINNWHCFQFDLTANQVAYFYSSACYGLYCGRCDDLILSNCLWLCGQDTATYFYASSLGNTFGSISNCDWDTNGGLNIQAVSGLALTNSQLSFPPAAGSGHHAIVLVAGSLSMTNCSIYCNGTTADLNAILQTGGTIAMSDCELTTNVDSCLYAITAGVTDFTDNTLSYGVAGSKSVALINILGGAGVISDNTFKTITTGTGTAITFSVDTYFVVNDNFMGNWFITASVALTQAAFDNNAFCGSDRLYTAICGAIRTKLLVGVCGSTGGASVAHGLANGHLSILGVDAWAEAAGGTGSAAMVPVTINSIDGSYINIAGAPASQPYRLTVRYIAQPLAWPTS